MAMSSAYDATNESTVYSGSQVSVLIKADGALNMPIPVNFTSVDFQVSQSKRPIYGFASQYFDAVAKGQVIVNGTFSINFSERNHLTMLLNDSLGIEPFLEEKVVESNKKAFTLDDVATNVSNMMNPGKPTFQLGGAPVDVSNSPEELRKMQKDVLSNKMKEDSKQWGDVGNHSSVKSNLEKEAGSITSLQNVFKYLSNNGFTLTLLYGAFSGEDDSLQDSSGYQNKIILDGMHVLGQGQRIEVTGQPVQEVYQFIAKNLV